MKTLREKIVNTLIEAGADMVGFGGIDRMAGCGIEEIFPKTRTVIAAAFRVLRGTHRGIEEGSTYYQYTTNAVETLEENIMPLAMLGVCRVLEDNSFDAVPQRLYQTVMSETGGTNPEVDWEEIYYGKNTESQLDMADVAIRCGLGERGLHGGLLTDQFGPLQRCCLILTDAALEETTIMQPHLCDGCGKCIAACPGNAIAEDGSIDAWQCAVYYKGANMTKNPFMPPEAFADDPQRLAIITGEAKLSPEKAKEILDEIIFYPPIKHAYVSSICGKACHRACYIHLEENGVLQKNFNSRFRKRPEWNLVLLK